MGTGLFTDRSTAPQIGLYPDARINRWGGSVGVRFENAVALSHTERARRLTFATTVALRYAVGVGRAQQLQVSLPEGMPNAATLVLENDTRADQHLVMLHVGAGLRF